jgi:2-oxoglutarate ferredoxin oxidoreductase subunit delta
MEALGLPKSARDIIIDKTLCKGCHICISVCPHGVLEKSKVVDNRGFYLPEVVDLDACRVCLLCEMHCPDFAIAVVAD